jgi:hypothetical protein
LCDEVGEHAIEPDGGEHERDDGEGEHEDRVELVLECGEADVLPQREDVRDGKIWV